MILGWETQNISSIDSGIRIKPTFQAAMEAGVQVFREFLCPGEIEGTKLIYAFDSNIHLNPLWIARFIELLTLCREYGMALVLTMIDQCSIKYGQKNAYLDYFAGEIQDKFDWSVSDMLHKYLIDQLKKMLNYTPGSPDNFPIVIETINEPDQLLGRVDRDMLIDFQANYAAYIRSQGFTVLSSAHDPALAQGSQCNFIHGQGNTIEEWALHIVNIRQKFVDAGFNIPQIVSADGAGHLKKDLPQMIKLIKAYKQTLGDQDNIIGVFAITDFLTYDAIPGWLPMSIEDYRNTIDFLKQCKGVI